MNGRTSSLPHAGTVPAPGSWLVCAWAYVVVGFVTLSAGLVVAIGHREKLETLLYVLVFVVFVPVSLVLARRQLVQFDRAEAQTVAIFNLGASALLIVVARSVWFVGSAFPVSLVLLVGGVAIGVANSTIFPGTAAAVGHSDRRRAALEIITGVLVVAALLSFFPAAFFNPARVLTSLVVAAGLSTLYLGRAALNPGKSIRGILDGMVVLTTVLLVVDVRDYGDLFRYDYDYFLGPANAIEHGHAVLVDTFSQYGVGLPLALAGAFQVVPLTYGGLQVILCAGYAIVFLLVYLILRLACRSQFIAVTGLAVAMVGNLVLPGLSRIGYPSIGPLRFGIPWLIVLFVLLAASRARFRRTCEVAALCTLGVATVWSFETMIYAIGTYLLMAAVESELRGGSRPNRLKRFAGYVAATATVCATSILAFSLLSRVIVSAWPDWGTYLGLIGRYSVKGFGTLLIPSWSVGYAIAGIYVISTLGLAVTIATASARNGEPGLASRNRRSDCLRSAFLHVLSGAIGADEPPPHCDSRDRCRVLLGRPARCGVSTSLRDLYGLSSVPRGLGDTDAKSEVDGCLDQRVGARAGDPVAIDGRVGRAPSSRERTRPPRSRCCVPGAREVRPAGAAGRRPSPFGSLDECAPRERNRQCVGHRQRKPGPVDGGARAQARP